MNQQAPNYQSFLVRIWHVENEGEILWRATLENATTGERLGFSSVRGLLDYLDSTTELMSYRIQTERKKKDQ